MASVSNLVAAKISASLELNEIEVWDRVAVHQASIQKEQDVECHIALG